jgi:hypothetical protein
LDIRKLVVQKCLEAETNRILVCLLNWSLI